MRLLSGPTVTVLRALPLVAVTSASGCLAPTPVRAFEDFYSATVRRDGPAVRAQLCGEARAAIVGVDDAALLSTFAVWRVVRRAALSEEPASADGAVGVVVEDALGATTTVALRPDAAAPRGWCVAGVASSPSPAQDTAGAR